MVVMVVQQCEYTCCTLKMAKMINFMLCIFCCNINVHTIGIYFYKPQKQVKLTYSEKR